VSGFNRDRTRSLRLFVIQFTALTLALFVVIVPARAGGERSMTERGSRNASAKISQGIALSASVPRRLEVRTLLRCGVEVIVINETSQYLTYGTSAEYGLRIALFDDRGAPCCDFAYYYRDKWPSPSERDAVTLRSHQRLTVRVPVFALRRPLAPGY